MFYRCRAPLVGLSSSNCDWVSNRCCSVFECSAVSNELMPRVYGLIVLSEMSRGFQLDVREIN